MSFPSHIAPPSVDQGIDRPDFSYLETQGPVAPQPLDHDAYVFDHGPNSNVIPLLDESDGLHVGADGKLHFLPIELAGEQESRPSEGGSAAQEVRHLAVPVIPGRLAARGLNWTVGGVYRSRFSDGSHRRGLHRA